MALTEEQLMKLRAVVPKQGKKEEKPQENNLLAQMRLSRKPKPKEGILGMFGFTEPTLKTADERSAAAQKWQKSTSEGGAQQAQQRFVEGTKNTFQKALGEQKEASRRGLEGEAGGLKTFTTTLGNLFEMLLSPVRGVEKAAEPLTEKIVKTAGDITKSVPEKILSTDIGKNIAEFGVENFIKPLEGIVSPEQQQKIGTGIEKLIELNKDPANRDLIEGIGNIVEVATMLSGAGLSKKPITEGVETIGKGLGETLGEATMTGKKFLNEAKEALPEMKIPNISEALSNPLEKFKGWKNQKLLDSVQTELNDFIGGKQSLRIAADEALKSNVDFRANLSKPRVYEGLKVENGYVNPNKAITVLDDDISEALSIASEMIPEAERILPEFPKDQLRKAAYANLESKNFSAGVEAKLKKKIDDEIKLLPETLSIGDIDKQRAKFRNSARDSKGQLKGDSEFAALENGARELVFDGIDQASGGAGEFAELRQYIKGMIDTKNFLDTKMRGATVKGGRLGKYSARMIGATAGSGTGPVGVILGSEAGGVISDILLNNQLGSSFKMRFIEKITDDPAVIKAARELLGEMKEKGPALLEAPLEGAPKSQTFGKDVIEMTRPLNPGEEKL